jgi:hypothetical protein
MTDPFGHTITIRPVLKSSYDAQCTCGWASITVHDDLTARYLGERHTWEVESSR